MQTPPSKARTECRHALASRWFNVSVTPGSNNLLLAQATSDWVTAIQRLRDTPGLSHHHLSAADITHNQSLPTRTDVKQGPKKGKGWPDVAFNPEAGFQAILQVVMASQAGTKISKSRSYPTIAELE